MRKTSSMSRKGTMKLDPEDIKLEEDKFDEVEKTDKAYKEEMEKMEK